MGDRAHTRVPPRRERHQTVRTSGALALALLLAGLLAGCPPRLSDVETFTREGDRYLQSGNYARAEAAYSAALSLEPGAAGVLINRGNARLLQEKVAEARADYTAALALEPGLALAYANRGMLHDRQGDTSGAIADYRRALELDPSLGEGPSVWERILRNPSPDTIRERLAYLLARRAAAP